jgi:hypothetical protein
MIACYLRGTCGHVSEGTVLLLNHSTLSYAAAQITALQRLPKTRGWERGHSESN